MNEHLNSHATRNTDGRGNSNDQHYAADPRREHSNAEIGTSETRRSALDTGSRGWRYVYQTH